MKLVICNNKSEVISNYKIRYEVFIKEQGVSYEDEFDLVEDEGDMFLLEENGKYVSCARVLYEKNNVAHLGRVATLKEYRGQNYASFMIKEIEKYLKHKGIQRVYLGAQIQAKDFYKKIGYHEYGEIFLDANIPHIHMEKQL